MATMERDVFIRLKDGLIARTRAVVYEKDGVLCVTEVKDLFEEISQADLQKLDKTFQISKIGKLIVRVKGERGDRDVIRQMRDIAQAKDFEVIAKAKRVKRGRVYLEIHNKWDDHRRYIESLKRLGFKEVYS